MKKEREEVGSKSSREEMDRGDFLKTMGLAAVGAAGLGAMMSAPAQAEEGKKGKYVIVVTHGGNNPNRAIWALLMAETIQKKGLGDVHVWMTIEGAASPCSTESW